MQKDDYEKLALELKHEDRIRSLKYKWIFSYFVVALTIILTYKFWGKSDSLQSLISLGSGFVSIALGVMAIAMTFYESVKSSNKEKKADIALDKVVENVKETKGILEKINDVVSGIDQKTSEMKIDFKNLRELYKNTYSDEEGTIGTASQSQETNDQSEANTQHYNQTNTNNIEYKNSQIQNNNTEASGNAPDIVIRGAIFNAELGAGIGAEIVGTRPVLIVSNDIVNKYAPIVTVVPIKSVTYFKPALPTHIPIEMDGRTGVALVDQMLTISKNRLLDFVIRLDDEVMGEIQRAILLQTGFE